MGMHLKCLFAPCCLLNYQKEGNKMQNNNEINVIRYPVKENEEIVWSLTIDWLTQFIQHLQNYIPPPNTNNIRYKLDKHIEFANRLLLISNQIQEEHDEITKENMIEQRLLPLLLEKPNILERGKRNQKKSFVSTLCDTSFSHYHLSKAFKINQRRMEYDFTNRTNLLQQSIVENTDKIASLEQEKAALTESVATLEQEKNKLLKNAKEVQNNLNIQIEEYQENSRRQNNEIKILQLEVRESKDKLSLTTNVNMENAKLRKENASLNKNLQLANEEIKNLCSFKDTMYNFLLKIFGQDQLKQDAMFFQPPPLSEDKINLMRTIASADEGMINNPIQQSLPLGKIVENEIKNEVNNIENEIKNNVYDIKNRVDEKLNKGISFFKGLVNDSFKKEQSLEPGVTPGNTNGI